MARREDQDEPAGSLFEGYSIYETLEELLGEETTQRLCRLYGGRTVYIPKRLNDDHWLVEAVGREAAEKLSNYFRANNSGTRLIVPRGVQHRASTHLVEVTQLSDEGLTAADIATALGIHERTVYRMRLAMNRKRATAMGTQIRRLLANGHSLEHLASETNLPLLATKAIVDLLEADDRRLRQKRHG